MSNFENVQILKDLKLKSGLHSPSPKEIEGALGFNPIKVDFCFLSNPYATDLVISHYKNKLSEEKLFKLFESYPASTDYVARNISKFEGGDPEKIVVGNGAIQAIEWVCSGWGIENLLIPIPTFSSYYEFLGDRCTLTGEFWLGDEKTAEHLIKLADEKGCDSILLINPNNPSGEDFPVEEIERLVNLTEKKIIIDESFCHFLEHYYEYKDLRNRMLNKNVTFIKSMSKDFGVAGLRLGYLYTNDSELREFCKLRATWNLNNFAVMFSDIIGDFLFQEGYRKARKRYLDERQDFYLALCEIPDIVVYKTQANFFLIKLPDVDPDFVYNILLETGVYVRTMDDKVGLDSSFIRVAARKKEENDLFLVAMANALQKACC